jgi:hypothetical protein
MMDVGDREAGHSQGGGMSRTAVGAAEEAGPCVAQQ